MSFGGGVHPKATFQLIATDQPLATKGGGSVVVDLLFSVLPIVFGRYVFVLLCITLCPF